MLVIVVKGVPCEDDAMKRLRQMSCLLEDSLVLSILVPETCSSDDRNTIESMLLDAGLSDGRCGNSAP